MLRRAVVKTTMPWLQHPSSFAGCCLLLSAAAAAAAAAGQSLWSKGTLRPSYPVC
jgi:hypothetical protein